MAQLQPQVPGPLADNLPALLPPGSRAAPPIRILLSILIREGIFKRAAMRDASATTSAAVKASCGKAVKNSS
jgi:hypothetical protein